MLADFNVHIRTYNRDFLLIDGNLRGLVLELQLVDVILNSLIYIHYVGGALGIHGMEQMEFASTYSRLCKAQFNFKEKTF